jgi:hypothetical protein
MKYVGDVKMSGQLKKKFVLNKLRDELDLPEILEEFIINIIDTLIQVENGKLVFNKKVQASLFNCCTR